MIFHLLATFMIGVLAASLAFVVFRAGRGRVPRFVIPFAAGLAMIGYNVWNEVTWLDRTVGVMPKQFAVIAKGQPASSLFAPWTYVVPRIDSFRVVDKASLAPHPKRDGLVLAQMHDVARYEAVRKSSWIVDCARGQMAEITGSTTFDADGVPDNVTWAKVPAGNTIIGEACPKPAPPPAG